MYRAEFRRVEGRYIRFEIQVHQSSDSVLSRRSRYPSLDKMKKWTVWSHQRLLTPHRRCSARLPGARTRPRAHARPRRRSRTRPRRDERDRARHRPSPVAPGASSSATFVRGWRRTHPRAGVPHPRTRRASAAPCPPPRDPPRGICARMRCVRRHHAAIASTRAFRLSAARSPAPASRLVARDIDEMPVGHHPRVVGSVIAESRLSPLPSLDLRPIAQPRRPALASPGAFDAPSKTAPGDPRALSSLATRSPRTSPSRPPPPPLPASIGNASPRVSSLATSPSPPTDSSSPIPLVDTAFASTPSRSTPSAPNRIASPDAAARSRRGARCPSTTKSPDPFTARRAAASTRR